MAAVSGSFASSFPNRLDSFTRFRNGTGLDSVLNANIWNKMLSASYRLEVHNQFIVRAGGEESTPRGRKRLFKLATHETLGTSTGFSVTIQLTAAEMKFMGNKPFRVGNLIMADVYALSGAAAGNYFVATCFPNGSINPSGLNISVTRIEPELRFTASVPAGIFRICLTIIGL